MDEPFAVDTEKFARDQRVVADGFWDKVRTTLGRVPFVEDALAAYYCTRDPATPLYVKAVLVGALAYFVVPADVIPDFMVGLGYADDASVLAAALGAVNRHLKPEHYERARAFLDGDAAGDEA